ncbi:MAG: HAMP domain-containing sensor histidine kinase [Eubacteriales bacterium]|nr:HAMP domain-containing sensor histidine kinase [Eubacteriales bacterium]
MKVRLRTKLSASYVLIILICVSAIILLSNIVLERQFQTYVTNQQKKEERNIISLLTQSYLIAGGWNEAAVEEIGVSALDNSLMVKVTDVDGTVLWDANTHQSDMCRQMMSNMSSNMHRRYSNWQGGYEEVSYEINNDGQTVGAATIGYYGPFYYTDSDLSFISTINTLIVWVGVFTALVALAIGIIISRQISNPIARVVEKAQKIADGSYGASITDKTKTIEIRRLIDTVNKLADTLQKQEERSAQASSDIAHELRTPLATIQGNLEAVMDGVWELNPERVKVLYDEILRISRLVGDLAELARYERKEAELHRESFDVAELIQDTMASVRSPFKTQGKTLRFQGEIQTISADRDQLHQVMLNLLSNALKYTREGDTVSVTLTGDSKAVQIKVRDTGVGIPQADLPYIFDRFYRADKSRSRKSGGAGIGLTIVKSIVTAHQGTITVNSQPDAGTEFTITLPRQ